MFFFFTAVYSPDFINLFQVALLSLDNILLYMTGSYYTFLWISNNICILRICMGIISGLESKDLNLIPANDLNLSNTVSIKMLSHLS